MFSFGEQCADLTGNGQAADAGIEYADGSGCCHIVFGFRNVLPTVWPIVRSLIVIHSREIALGNCAGES